MRRDTAPMGAACCTDRVLMGTGLHRITTHHPTAACWACSDVYVAGAEGTPQWQPSLFNNLCMLSAVCYLSAAATTEFLKPRGMQETLLGGCRHCHHLGTPPMATQLCIRQLLDYHFRLSALCFRLCQTCLISCNVILTSIRTYKIFPGSMPFPPGGQPGSPIPDVLLLAAGTWSNKIQNEEKRNKSLDGGNFLFPPKSERPSCSKRILQWGSAADPLQSQKAGGAELKTSTSSKFPLGLSAWGDQRMRSESPRNQRWHNKPGIQIWAKMHHERDIIY